jgi:hypothetical protein
MTKHEQIVVVVVIIIIIIIITSIIISFLYLILASHTYVTHADTCSCPCA